ncbi:MAG: hypothetical protein LBQ90_08770 [Synergistaceae bacterium]|nr:hypothetical protein [Synergistaceae bacterium]
MKAALTILVVALSLCVPVFPARAVVEADPDLQLVMGDLLALTVAMRLHRDDTRGVECPTVDQLADRLQSPLSANLREDFRTIGVNGAWWVGRRVPNYSRARPFLRANAESLGLYDRESMSFWMGGSFVWIKGVEFDSAGKAMPPTSDIRVAEGGGKDAGRLFFNVRGTDRHWWSDLSFTPATRKAALERFGVKQAELLVVPPPPSSVREGISASPVHVPPEFSVGAESSDVPAIEMGDVLFTPLPRPRGGRE